PVGLVPDPGVLGLGFLLGVCGVRDLFALAGVGIAPDVDDEPVADPAVLKFNPLDRNQVRRMVAGVLPCWSIPTFCLLRRRRRRRRTPTPPSLFRGMAGHGVQMALPPRPNSTWIPRIDADLARLTINIDQWRTHLWRLADRRFGSWPSRKHWPRLAR